MTAIFKREFRACFTGIIGWLFMAVILALFGLYFFVYNLLSGYAYISYTLSAMAFIMLIAVPILTMRILSEDRHTKADQLMLTSPVSVWKIVLGKFFALGALFSIDMLIIAVTPLVLSLYGTVPMGESYTAILGFWLYGLACIAVGLFISGITESQLIAAVVSFVVLFIGYMMPNICSLISEGGNVLTKILSCFDLYSALGPFMAGTLDITCVIYYITLITIALFLAIQMIEKRRWSVSAKRIGLGVFSIATIIVVCAAAVLINFGVRRIPTEYTSIDTTYNKMFVLTDETKEYIASLESDVDIYVWAAEGNADTTLTETLERYSDLSKHLKVSFINPIDNPTFYTAYTQEEPSDNSLIVVSDLRSRVIDYDDIYEYSYDYDYYSYSIDAYDAEGQITSAIGYVTMDAELMPRIYILEGHDEVALGERFTDAMAKANITTEGLNLLLVDKVPDDCKLLIINGAMSDISSDDLDKIESFLSDGGSVLLATSYDAVDEPHIEQLLSEYGITKSEGIVMENDASYVYSNVGYYLLPDVVDCIYTSDITNGYVFAPFAAGLKADTDDEDYLYTEVLRTSDTAVTMTAGEDEGADEALTTDEGPFLIGVAVTDYENGGTLIALGSIDLLNDDADSIVAGSNLALFKGILSVHAADTEDAESKSSAPVIASKPYTVNNLVINSAAGSIVGLIIMIILPIAMVAAGIVVWNSRRKR